MIKLIWKRIHNHPGHYGYAGNIRLFTVSYDSWKPRGDPKPWVLTSTLPGLNSDNWYRDGEKEPDLIDIAAKELQDWITAIGVEAVLR